MNGPIPTRLVFISELPAQALHTKVRFLGCVTQYNVLRGRLELEHNYPPLSRKDTRNDLASAASRRISVDIYHVLDSITKDHLQVGNWLNVFGYIRSEKQEQHSQDHLVNGTFVGQFYVEAVMVSNAGAIHLAEYEQSLSEMHANDRV